MVAVIAEGVPEKDTKHLIAFARANNKVLIGPATVGGVQVRTGGAAAAGIAFGAAGRGLQQGRFLCLHQGELLRGRGRSVHQGSVQVRPGGAAVGMALVAELPRERGRRWEGRGPTAADMQAGLPRKDAVGSCGGTKPSDDGIPLHLTRILRTSCIPLAHWSYAPCSEPSRLVS